MNTNLSITATSHSRGALSSFVRNVLSDERGQTLPFVALLMTAMLGFSGLVVDVGRAYVVRGELQNSANAAALAASGFVYDSNSSSVNSTSMANQYSSSSGGSNVYSSLGTVNTSVKTRCVNMLMPSGTTCSSSSAANAVVVNSNTTINTFFMALFGVKTLAVNATATASMQGYAQPWNVAIVLDATDSMVSSTDSNCTSGSSGSVTRLQCALDGIQAFLQATNPCPPGEATCSTGAKLRVSLFRFPNITTATAPDDYGCAGTIPTPEPYTLPLTNATSYTPLTYSTTTGSGKSATTTSWTATYQSVGFSSDYWSSGKMSSTSNLAKAVGAVSGCSPLNTKGGESTYYGGVIYAAQAALLAEQAANAGSQNAIILLSDGQAQAVSSKFAPPATTPTTAGYSALSSNGTYPAAADECQQAIVAAQNAALAGTRVYAVAYGSESSGCTTAGGGTDSTLLTLPSTPNQTFSLSGANALTPCITMENIASSLQYFYSDFNQSGSGSTCQDSSHTVTTLSQIFQAISADFTTPRLIPNNAAGTAAS